MLKRICNILSIIILISMLIIAGILLLPYAFGYQTLAVLSGSMEPVYPVGSIVFVQKVPAAEIQVGDPITFRLADGSTYATHRVVRIDSSNEQFITKGDANDAEDSPTDFKNLVGRASSYSVPLLGYISIYIKTPTGIMAMTGVAVVVILLTFLPEIFAKGNDSSEVLDSQEPQTT